MVCFLNRVIIYSSWLWNIGCNLKEGLQELWIFLISQNESSAQHVTIARYDMKNPIKIVNLLICMDFHSVKPTCWLSVINPQAPAAVATDDRTRITAKQLKNRSDLTYIEAEFFSWRIRRDN